MFHHFTSQFASHTSSLLAHVTYVVDPEKLKELEWKRDWDFLFEPIRDPFYLALIAITLIVVLALFVACELIAPLRKVFQEAHNKLISYHVFVPFILRVALGVALIGAGVHKVIFLPTIPGAAISTLEVILGFCLFIGFMGRMCGVAALVLFFYGMYSSYYMWGTLETAGASLLVIGYGSDHPSMDDILGTNDLFSFLDPLWKMIRDNTGPILRIAMGTTLIWLAISEKALSPRLSEVIIIEFNLTDYVPVSNAMWVFAVMVIELAVGSVLVLGFFTRSFSLIAFLVLTISFFYFKEAVAGHVTFFGSLITLMITGAGNYSIDAIIARKTRQVVGTTTPYILPPTPATD